MHVVAVGALDQAFIHLVVYRHVELRLLVGVALVAERGLRRLEQRLLLATVDVVAADATDAGFGMRRAFEVGMRSRVAAQALFLHILGACVGGVEYLGDVAATINVCFARAVAVLAGGPVAAVHLGHLGVGIAGELLGHLVVAGSAGVAAYKIPWRGFLGLSNGWLGARIGVGRLSSESSGADYESRKASTPR